MHANLFKIEQIYTPPETSEAAHRRQQSLRGMLSQRLDMNSFQLQWRHDPAIQMGLGVVRERRGAGDAPREEHPRRAGLRDV